MRSGGSCGVQLQQGLTAEAASVVKQAVTLAKRRGHAQVTPLHVANTMLGSANGFLRRACLQSQSHSHPLQCKALELCFNVALNRLPSAASSNSNSAGAPFFGVPVGPSFSNALLAAFKRAQAHQRRGSLDTSQQQQQPLLALKIELEQLVISILDDPSVSRVMREAGFSSTLVKINVEQAVSSLDLSSHKQNNDNCYASNPTTLVSSDPVRSEDVWSVIESLMSQRRRRSTVVVGECVSSLEGVVRGVMDKVEKGDVDEGMRGIKFISLSPPAFGHVSKAEVENKIDELKGLAKTTPPCKAFVLYVGDLEWVFEHRARSSYCAVEHMIMEVGKLVNGIRENNNNDDEEGRFRVMGIATFQTFMRCKNGHPSLENVWGLHPLTIPAGSLRLSLITTDTDSYSNCGVQNHSANRKADNGSKWFLLEPEEKFAQVQTLHSSTCNSASSTPLPAWLQQYKHENSATSNDQNCVPVGDLCKKWNSMYSCQTPIHKQPYLSEKTLTIVSCVSAPSAFSYNQRHHQWQVADEPEQPPWDHSFWFSQGKNHNTNNNKPNEPTLRLHIPQHNHAKQPFIFPPSNPSSNPNSASSSSSEAMETDYVSKFKEVNSENLKTLCNALEKKVPWQKDLLGEIVSTILQCRSGVLRRKGRSEAKEDTWLFFQGADMEAKEKIGRELGRLIFGGSQSWNNLVSIGVSSSSSSSASRSDQEEYYCCRNKRSREEQSCSYIERLADAVCRNPHRVFMLEDIEEADYGSQLGLKRAIERGRLVDSNGEHVCLRDAIIILSCQTFSSKSRTCSPPVKQKSWSEEDKDDDDDNNNNSKNMATLEDTIRPCVSLDLNISIDDDCDKDRPLDEIGLLESVDRRIIFKIQD